MSIALERPMTLDEFLLWEQGQDLRWEFDGFMPVAMTGGTADHSAMQRNLAIAVGGRLRGQRCQLYTADLKVLVAGSIRYPDAFVACTPVPGDALVVTDPVVVFEVLSPSTASTDIGAKNQEYRDTPSVQRYVMLAQDRRQATVFARSSDDWVGHIVSGDTILHMPEIGISVPLAELYDGVALHPPGAPVNG
ncbi:Uma2 family endonuclease [Rhodopila sp.]|uniref:Uma2 family endonuclease n=1 Tax=Rhodopila sp. TaxID=2480087 RepID=UPI003D0D5C95